MITDVCQRWREHRASYRPAGEPFDPRAFEVAEIADDSTPKAFVLAHHYAASYPSARYRFGLYRGSELAGVAVFSTPMHDAVLAPAPGVGDERAELGRIVLLDDVKANGESWFLARAFELVQRKGIVGLVSFSDPEPRTALDGRRVHKGHVGTIYQATNATYTGLATPRTLHLLPDGSVLSDRAKQKIRARERGWEYAVRQLVAAGAAPLEAGQDARAWLRAQLPRCTRTMRHSGNHRYVFGLDRHAKREIERRVAARTLRRLKYPKMQLEGLFASAQGGRDG